MNTSSKLHILLFGFISETEILLSALKKEANYYISQCTGLDSLKRILIENCDFDILVLQLNYKESNVDEILDFVTDRKEFPVLIVTNCRVRRYVMNLLQEA
ncbi:hypothetical protein [Zunongwangia endophytica]|uniref:hypothetical protein n=1 Tax=Zunongwangia endophytica TaxID=1808945 RepID=UPI0025B3CAA3|nr:hypothetical protein [Zunongwangia endophytica]MDN3593285.1 hypothetical protein [Zunongwangia endophytica]